MAEYAELLQRSGNGCELCGASEGLSALVVSAAPAGAKANVLVCATCLEAVDHPTQVEAKHWYGLKDGIWSEFDAVKVLAYRILKRLPEQAWAQDLLGQIYLDDEAQQWADADSGGGGNDEADGKQVVDSNGTPLAEGDSVTLIKDLVVKGANFTAKRGTVVKGIQLTDDPKYIEGRVNGTRIVLVAAYLKKA